MNTSQSVGILFIILGLIFAFIEPSYVYGFVDALFPGLPFPHIMILIGSVGLIVVGLTLYHKSIVKSTLHSIFNYFDTMNGYDASKLIPAV